MEEMRCGRKLSLKEGDHPAVHYADIFRVEQRGSHGIADIMSLLQLLLALLIVKDFSPSPSLTQLSTID